MDINNFIAMTFNWEFKLHFTSTNSNLLNFHPGMFWIYIFCSNIDPCSGCHAQYFNHNIFTRTPYGKLLLYCSRQQISYYMFPSIFYLFNVINYYLFYFNSLWMRTNAKRDVQNLMMCSISTRKVENKVCLLLRVVFCFFCIDKQFAILFPICPLTQRTMLLAYNSTLCHE